MMKLFVLGSVALLLLAFPTPAEAGMEEDVALLTSSLFSRGWGARDVQAYKNGAARTEDPEASKNDGRRQLATTSLTIVTECKRSSSKEQVCPEPPDPNPYSKSCWDTFVATQETSFSATSNTQSINGWCILHDSSPSAFPSNQKCVDALAKLPSSLKAPGGFDMWAGCDGDYKQKATRRARYYCKDDNAAEALMVDMVTTVTQAGVKSVDWGSMLERDISTDSCKIEGASAYDVETASIDVSDEAGTFVVPGTHYGALDYQTYPYSSAITASAFASALAVIAAALAAF